MSEPDTTGSSVQYLSLISSQCVEYERIVMSARSLHRCMPGFLMAEAHTKHLGHAGFLHGDAVDYVRSLHHALGVCDYYELCVSAQGMHQAAETVHVCLVERGVYLVQHTERTRPELENAHEESQSC